MTTTTTDMKLKYLVTSMPEALQSLDISSFTLVSCYAPRRRNRTPLKDTTAGIYRFFNQQIAQPWLWWSKLLTELQLSLSLSLCSAGWNWSPPTPNCIAVLKWRQEDGELLAVHTLEHHVTLNKGLYHAETCLWRSISTPLNTSTSVRVPGCACFLKYINRNEKRDTTVVVSMLTSNALLGY